MPAAKGSRTKKAKLRQMTYREVLDRIITAAKSGDQDATDATVLELDQKVLEMLRQALHEKVGGYDIVTISVGSARRENERNYKGALHTRARQIAGLGEDWMKFVARVILGERKNA